MFTKCYRISPILSNWMNFIQWNNDIFVFLVNCPRITDENKCKFLIIARKLISFFGFTYWSHYVHIKASSGTCKSVDLVLVFFSGRNTAPFISRMCFKYTAVSAAWVAQTVVKFRHRNKGSKQRTQIHWKEMANSHFFPLFRSTEVHIQKHSNASVLSCHFITQLLVWQ